LAGKHTAWISRRIIQKTYTWQLKKGGFGIWREARTATVCLPTADLGRPTMVSGLWSPVSAAACLSYLPLPSKLPPQQPN